MTVLVGFAGGSGAGKSAVLRCLLERLDDACVFDLDSYYLDRRELAPDVRAHLNYDQPEAFDLPLLVDHLHRLAGGEPVSKPCYSFATHTRTGSTTFEPAQVVLVEGLFTLWWEEVRRLLHLTLYVDVPADLRALRRLSRDVRERGRTVESTVSQYLHTVRPMHDKYVEPTKTRAQYVLDNTGSVEDCTNSALALVRPLLTRVSGSQAPARYSS